MASYSERLAAAESSTLLIVPDRVDERALKRAAFVSAMLDTDLQVYCPIAVPPAPHSWMTPAMSPLVGQLGPARERGRRLACQVQASLNAKDVEAYVETGICQSITDGIRNAVDRLEPTVLMYPKPDRRGLIDQPHRVQHDEISSEMDTPTWIVHPHEPPGDAVVGLVPSASRTKANRVTGSRIARTAARLAGCSSTAAHLLGRPGRAPALAIVREVMSPSDARVENFRSRGMSGHLAELATAYGISAEHVGLLQDDERQTLEQQVERLKAGLVVTDSTRHRGFAALRKPPPATELIDLPCDLLLLNDSEFPFA